MASPVLISVLSALIGALAGLAPSLFMSERRRRLHYLRDESEVYNSLQDSETKQHLADAMRATARRYAEIADITHVKALQRQARAVFPFAGTSIVVGLIIQVTAFIAEQSITWFFNSGLVIMGIGTSSISLTYSRVMRARLEASLREREDPR